MKFFVFAAVSVLISNVSFGQDTQPAVTSEQAPAQTAPTSSSEQPPVTDNAAPATPVAPAAPVSPAYNPPPSQMPAEKRIRFGMSLHLSGANKIRFENATASTTVGSGTGQAEFNTKGAFGIGATIMSSAPTSWGFSGSLFYEADREIDSLTLSDSTGSVTGTYASPKPKVSFLVIEGNLLYRWNDIYLPFGFNVSSPNFTRGAGATGTLDVKGGLGAQVGFGAFVTENLAFDFVIRSISIRMSGATSTATYDYGPGFISGAAVGMRYLFQ
jgi:hypothetical protein